MDEMEEMVDYLDEKEQFELEYQQELEMMEEIDQEEDATLQSTSRHQLSSCGNDGALSFSQNNSGINNLSQIGGPTNVFGTPQGLAGRTASTPLSNINKSKFSRIKNILPSLQEVAELENSTPTLASSSSQPPNKPEAVALTSEEGGVKRKRLEQDLFGDIDDLYGYDYENEKVATKKLKSEEEADMELIENILQIRKEMRDNNRCVIKDNLELLKTMQEFKRRNFSTTIPKWPFIPLTGGGGVRIYVRFHSEDYETQQLNAIKANNSIKGINFLGAAKADIWKEVNHLYLKRLTNNESNCGSLEQLSAEGRKSVDTTLWVEKYKPRKYVDLLSSESTNRSLLCWVKMWDKIVFGKEFKQPNVASVAGDNNLNTFNKRTGKFELTGGWRSRKPKILVDPNRDELGRPVQKIALLWGPPGLGKTTLAHMIARQAGYNVRELNASDDRSVDAFKTTLEDCTQMSSWSKSNLNDRKPNCIIIDEIDGAPKQSIDFLVKFVTDSILIRKAKGVAKKAKYHILKRPIICICNDVYSPALRSLRQIAMTVEFSPVESERLAERLILIAEEEDMNTDMGSLLTLAEKSGCDVRSCVSTMQFFSIRNKSLTLANVLNTNYGLKDRRQGLLDVWKAIFRIQRQSKPLLPNTDITDKHVMYNDTILSNRTQHILSVVQSAGDYDRILQGVHENFLHLKMAHPDLKGVVVANQWFCFFDLLQRQVNQLQEYTVYPYLQYGFAKWHQLFGSYSLPNLKFPSKAFEFSQKHTLQLNIWQSLRKSMTASVSFISRGQCFLLEVVPLLKRIISPQLRSVAIQLLSIKEQKDLRHTVEIMADLGLTYTQIKSYEGTYSYQLEPDLDLLAKFPGFDGVTVSHFGRQLLTREIELECIHRAVPKIAENLNPPTEKLSKGAKLNDVKNSRIPNHLQRLVPKLCTSNDINSKDMKVKPAPVFKDFFGRINCTKNNTDLVSGNKGNDNPIVKSPIWYRYKEGYNNAVRKDIYMKELM